MGSRERIDPAKADVTIHQVAWDSDSTIREVDAVREWIEPTRGKYLTVSIEVKDNVYIITVSNTTGVTASKWKGTEIVDKEGKERQVAIEWAVLLWRKTFGCWNMNLPDEYPDAADEPRFLRSKDLSE